MRVGLICRMDKSGLGAQTRRLARLLNPDYLMVIDSTPFNSADQYPGWYGYHHKTIIKGFPGEIEINTFLEKVDVVISCETFYNNYFTALAKQKGVKTILIANPEFFDWFKPEWKSRITLPDKIIVPSEWMMDKMKEFNAEYLPTPIFEDEFEQARETNLKRRGKPRYLFINGKSAVHDRAGLNDLYEALQLSKGDFEIVIKAQGEIKKHPDPRITYDFSNPDEQYKLYQGFDALIHPRRYGGQSLPMCEALQSALPVIMTDIDPNNKILPRQWLVPTKYLGEFKTRTMINLYSAEPDALASDLDTLSDSKFDLNFEKERALLLSKQYDAENLRPKYEALLSSL
jgi:hypothetical protein